MKTSTLAAAAATCVLAFSALGAQAAIVNIDATTGKSVSLTLQPGEYRIAVVGKAGGGLYDAWTYNSASNLFRDAYTIADTADGQTFSIDFDNGGSKFSNFSSAAGALSEFATGPFTIYYGSTDGTVLTSGYAFIPLTIVETSTLAFGVPDYKFDDNSGGVSLAVTAAVPEPETYALMLAGVGALGFIARRRKSV